MSAFKRAFIAILEARLKIYYQRYLNLTGSEVTFKRYCHLLALKSNPIFNQWDYRPNWIEIKIEKATFYVLDEAVALAIVCRKARNI